jgi:hypothetical protein
MENIYIISNLKMNLPCIPRSTQSLILLLFPHLAESGFNWVTYLLSKVRYRNVVVKRDGLRLSLTTLQLATCVQHVRNTLNIMPVINTTFYLCKETILYLNEILKKYNIANKRNINVF